MRVQVRSHCAQRLHEHSHQPDLRIYRISLRRHNPLSQTFCLLRRHGLRGVIRQPPVCINFSTAVSCPLACCFISRFHPAGGKLCNCASSLYDYSVQIYLGFQRRGEMAVGRAVCEGGSNCMPSTMFSSSICCSTLEYCSQIGLRQCIDISLDI
jgi:hypothetical protein